MRKPLYARSFKTLGKDLRKAADRVADADGDELIPALKHFRTVEVAWDAARPRDAKNCPVA